MKNVFKCINGCEVEFCEIHTYRTELPNPKQCIMVLDFKRADFVLQEKLEPKATKRSIEDV